MNTNGKNKLSQIIPWEFLIIAIVILFVLFVRLRFSDMPLERDEGEFAYIATLIIDGHSPFEAYNYKIPGVSYVYAFFILLFGKTIFAVKFGLLFVSIASIILLYLFVKQVFNSYIAIIATVSYALLSTHSSVLGNAAHATHFINLFAFAGFYVFLLAYSNKKYLLFFAGGLLLGITFLMKQPAVFLFPIPFLFLLYILIKEKFKNILPFFINSSLLFAGIVIPFLLVIVITVITGEFEQFWKWNYIYPRNYGSAFGFKEGLNIFNIMFPIVIEPYKLLWYLTGFGFIASFFKAYNRDNRILFIMFFIFSFLTVVPGYYFRNHYFITFLPAVSVALAYLFYFVSEKIKIKNIRQGLMLVFLIIAVSYVKKHEDYYFIKDTDSLSREIYRGNPFADSQKIGQFLKSRASKNDKLAVLGSEAQILYYSGLKSATGFMYTYDLVRKHPYSNEMQQLMIDEIEEAFPKFIIYVNINTSWLVQPDAPKTIFEWSEKFVEKNYNLIALMDIFSDKSNFVWGEHLYSYQSQSNNHLAIFEKKIE